jgi:hypothetical protein
LRIIPHGEATYSFDQGIKITSNPNNVWSGAGVDTTWQFIGDFDAQVDYQLDDWDGYYEPDNESHIDVGMGIIMDGGGNMDVKSYCRSILKPP